MVVYLMYLHQCDNEDEVKLIIACLEISGLEQEDDFETILDNDDATGHTLSSFDIP